MSATVPQSLPACTPDAVAHARGIARRSLHAGLAPPQRAANHAAPGIRPTAQTTQPSTGESALARLGI